MADNTSGNNWTRRVAYLRGLADIVREEGLSLLELEGDDWKITLKGATPQFVAAPTNGGAVPFVGAAPSGVASPFEENLVAVVSPMVGVFYRSPSPSDPPFVEVGDRVEAGQTIGLVEAMKVFNEITAETGGVVAQINAESGQLVETGAPLLSLRR